MRGASLFDRASDKSGENVPIVAGEVSASGWSITSFLSNLRTPDMLQFRVNFDRTGSAGGSMGTSTGGRTATPGGSMGRSRTPTPGGSMGRITR